MPPWAVAHGGSLNFFHIENLVTLITTNAGNAWEDAVHLAVEQDELTLAGLEEAADLAVTGTRASFVATAVNAAIDAAGGDLDVALETAILELTRDGITAQLKAEFAEALAEATAADDDDALEALEAEMAAREVGAAGGGRRRCPERVRRGCRSRADPRPRRARPGQSGRGAGGARGRHQ